MGDVKGKATNAIKTTFAGSGSGTEEDPYVVPKTKLTKKSVLTWLDKQDIPDDAIITWKKITGTVAQLIEYLTK